MVVYAIYDNGSHEEVKEVIEVKEVKDNSLPTLV
jgi:hypothetical protein